VARQPRWEGAWNGLGWSSTCAGQYQVALQAFQEAVSLDPAYRDVGVGLAYALFELGRYREALPHLHRLTREGAYLYFPEPNSDVEEVRSRYAWCLYYTGGISRPATNLPRGFRPIPSGRASTVAGLDVSEAGDRAKARESFQQALRLDPEYADARKGLAEANR